MFSPRSCYDILWGSRAVRASCRPHPRPHAEMPSLTRGCATALASHRSSKSEISIETGAKKEKKKNAAAIKELTFLVLWALSNLLLKSPNLGFLTCWLPVWQFPPAWLWSCCVSPPQAVPRCVSPPVSPSFQHQKAAGSATGCLGARGVGITESNAGKILINHEHMLLF